MTHPMTACPQIEAFITRWQAAGGSERANYQQLLTELCEVLDLPRPDYQNPDSPAPQQLEAELDTPDAATPVTVTATAAGKQAWPRTMREQVAAVRAALTHRPHTIETLATEFKRKPQAAVQSVLEALESLGMVEAENGLYRLQG